MHLIENYALIGHNMVGSTAHDLYMKSGLFKLPEGEWNGYAFHHPKGTILGCTTVEKERRENPDSQVDAYLALIDKYLKGGHKWWDISIELEQLK